MPDSGRTQRPAAVRTAAVVTTMLNGGAVLDEGPSRALVPAPAQLCVEGVQGVRIQRTNFYLAEKRCDVIADIAPVKRQSLVTS